MIGAVLTFWHWWTGELAGLVPAGLRAFWSGMPRPFEITFSPTAAEPSRHGRHILLPFSVPIDNGALEPLGKLLRRGARHAADVCWPKAGCLERVVGVPRGARRQAMRIAELDLVRSTPIARESVLWQARLERTHTGDWQVRQIVVRKDDVAALEAALEDLGIRLRRLAVEGFGSAIVERTADVARPWRWWRRLGLAATVAVVFAAGYLVLAPHWARQVELDRLAAEAAALRTEALTLRAAAEEAEAAQANEAAFLDALMTRPRLSIVLSGITRTLPDEAWLQGVDFDSGGIRIAGQTTGRATALIPALSQPAGFRNPVLVGPVALDGPGGAERFQIAITFEGRPHDR